MVTNTNKRNRESRSINEKYEIIKFYEDLVKKKVQNAKTRTVEQFKLKQVSTLNSILSKCMQVNDFKLMLYSAIDNSKIQTKITDLFNK
jgi:hypothetical protein